MEELLAMMGDGTQKAQLKILLKGDDAGLRGSLKKAIMDIQSDKVECVFLNCRRRSHLGIGCAAGFLF